MEIKSDKVNPPEVPGPKPGTRFLFSVEVKEYTKDAEGTDIMKLHIMPEDVITYVRRGDMVNLELSVWDD